MSINTNSYASSMYSNNASEVEKAKTTDKAKKADGYGKTIGEPKLSDKAAKYYEQLKKKYGNYDFVLVSNDQRENAQANAGKYANGNKTVVLIDEEKIEKMATDDSFRKKYEGILSGATKQLEQMKNSMMQSGANVKGYGMQVNEDGSLSFFAVLRKSSAEQKARIERNHEKKLADKKDAEKKALKKEREERLKASLSGEDDEETVTISANSIEELMNKLGDFTFAERSNNVQTDTEKMLGQHIDFRG